MVKSKVLYNIKCMAKGLVKDLTKDIVPKKT